MIAFLLAPWARYMRSLGVSPRALANDLLISAQGPGHLILFQRGYSGTFAYQHGIGAKISAKKWFTYSTDSVTREQLRHHYWTHIQSKLNCLVTARDLGGQLNTGKRLSSSTLTARMNRATGICQKLGAMPWSRDAKIKIIMSLVLPCLGDAN